MQISHLFLEFLWFLEYIFCMREMMFYYTLLTFSENYVNIHDLFVFQFISNNFLLLEQKNYKHGQCRLRLAQKKRILQ